MTKPHQRDPKTQSPEWNQHSWRLCFRPADLCTAWVLLSTGAARFFDVWFNTNVPMPGMRIWRAQRSLEILCRILPVTLTNFQVSSYFIFASSYKGVFFFKSGSVHITLEILFSQAWAVTIVRHLLFLVADFEQQHLLPGCQWRLLSQFVFSACFPFPWIAQKWEIVHGPNIKMSGLNLYNNVKRAQSFCLFSDSLKPLTGAAWTRSGVGWGRQSPASSFFRNTGLDKFQLHWANTGSSAEFHPSWMFLFDVYICVCFVQKKPHFSPTLKKSLLPGQTRIEMLLFFCVENCIAGKPHIGVAFWIWHRPFPDAGQQKRRQAILTLAFDIKSFPLPQAKCVKYRTTLWPFVCFVVQILDCKISKEETKSTCRMKGWRFWHFRVSQSSCVVTGIADGNAKQSARLSFVDEF